MSDLFSPKLSPTAFVPFTTHTPKLAAALLCCLEWFLCIAWFSPQLIKSIKYFWVSPVLSVVVLKNDFQMQASRVGRPRLLGQPLMSFVSLGSIIFFNFFLFTVQQWACASRSSILSDMWQSWSGRSGISEVEEGLLSHLSFTSGTELEWLAKTIHAHTRDITGHHSFRGGWIA